MRPEIYDRQSIRLEGYDYSQAGAYFVTICVRDKRCLLGDVADGKSVPNDLGAVVSESWNWLAERYDYVRMDEWVVMPNHLHGIVLITNEDRRGGSRTAQGSDGPHHEEGGSRTAPTETDSGRSLGPAKRKPLGRLVGAFKTVSTKCINEIRGSAGAAFWQRNFHEHIVRDQTELNLIREYIAGNPAAWETDRENPDYRRAANMTRGKVVGAVREPPIGTIPTPTGARNDAWRV